MQRCELLLRVGRDPVTGKSLVVVHQGAGK
jgi:hypothetical protein